MDANDVSRLRELIERHARYTNSAKAKTILADWAGWVHKFRKVMPTEYARALAEMAKVQQADTTGFNVLEVGMPAKKGTAKGKAAN
jgi:glutamate synthase (NADPH) large chain